ncbi:MAG TPA: hypothetical protein VGR89_11805 [Puia sp.]|nr:hypothetical protein [Puia sp.]
MLRLNNKLSTLLANWTRKSAVTLALLATVGMGSAFARPTDNSNDIVLASFHKEFRTADIMKVENNRDYTKVTFRLNDAVMFAYYGENGNLIAIVRNIPSTQLPIQLLMELKNKHSDSWITDLFEINSGGQTSYYVTLENSDTVLTLRADDASGWSTYRKTVKDNQ